ncbi:MAG: alpha-glucan family phosphorylase [Methanothrix sp.]|nr:alpha-glucan family phosphorylase [Methanothrix sp.]
MIAIQKEVSIIYDRKETFLALSTANRSNCNELHNFLISMNTRSIFQRALPHGLEELYDLALDLRWTGSQMTDLIWKMLDPEAWEITNNPYLILENVSEEKLMKAAKDEDIKTELASILRKRKSLEDEISWFDKNSRNRDIGTVAYFSMEFGLSEALPIYSGGLGILAGDFLKTASDMGIPVVGVGLLYQQGYFRQILDYDGSQIEAYPYNDPTSLPIIPVQNKDGSWLRTRVMLPGRDLILRLWKAKVGRMDLYLLDSNDPLNTPWDRGITATLYPAGRERRLVQEIALGIGGWKALQEMGIDVRICHLNEGHAAFLVLARAYDFMKKTGLTFSEALWATRAGNVFTTHTPVAAGFDTFPLALIMQYLQRYIESSGATMQHLLKQFHIDSESPLITAQMAMRGCYYANGVSQIHGQVSKEIFSPMYHRWPLNEVPVDYVTNGVHIPSWDSPDARRLWENVLQGYHLSAPAGMPWEEISRISDSELWQSRIQSRQSMIEYIRHRLVRQAKEHNASKEIVEKAAGVLDPEVLTIGFARRFADYKRPTLLIRKPDRLERILLDNNRPVQLVIAGKAHPEDHRGKDLVRTMAQFASRASVSNRVVFLEDYDIALARRLEPGIDLWINVPRRPMEACGTSGMKVLVNGGLNLSELDGWWAEAYSPQVGWSLGDGMKHEELSWDEEEADQLYRLLEEEVVPLFYDRDSDNIPRDWITKVRRSMSQLTPRFSSHRMLREYLEKAYLPGALAYSRRTARGAKLALELDRWHSRVDEVWEDLRFGELRAKEEDNSWIFEVEVNLGRMDPGDVQVQLYADPVAGGAALKKIMQDRGESGKIDMRVYRAEIPATRPAEDFTPRIIPYHPEASIPREAVHVLWYK